MWQQLEPLAPTLIESNLRLIDFFKCLYIGADAGTDVRQMDNVQMIFEIKLNPKAVKAIINSENG